MTAAPRLSGPIRACAGLAALLMCGVSSQAIAAPAPADAAKLEAMQRHRPAQAAITTDDDHTLDTMLVQPAHTPLLSLLGFEFLVTRGL